MGTISRGARARRRGWARAARRRTVQEYCVSFSCSASAGGATAGLMPLFHVRYFVRKFITGQFRANVCPFANQKLFAAPLELASWWR